VEKIQSWFQLLFLDEDPDLGDIYFNAMLLVRSHKERQQILELFHISGPERDLIRSRWDRLSLVMRDLAKGEKMSHSAIARLAGQLGIEDLLLIMSMTKREGTAKAVSLYLSRLRFITREIDGKTLRSMGYPTGPIFREIMQAVLDARVDGIVNSLAEEKKWVRLHFPPEKADAETRGHGDKGKTTPGNAETRGQGDAGKAKSHDEETRGRGDTNVQGD
jgi:tRNA nucleotidyltransferase (CCA-adding enzyme)